ncbi:hypothetical protein GGU10DRAFT_149903 [Lentinula aff. detonsa]|uniref:Uncharacterized protein n=1 Tax=Lentinula aff. detonsa TaxID=2804958 RepID=A0AA38KRY1_9AGAR|nr:hypothetical protein GGU10DRAFT_149903 [Lentinula aff. detonsa]
MVPMKTTKIVCATGFTNQAQCYVRQVRRCLLSLSFPIIHDCRGVDRFFDIYGFPLFGYPFKPICPTRGHGGVNHVSKICCPFGFGPWSFVRKYKGLRKSWIFISLIPSALIVGRGSLVLVVHPNLSFTRCHSTRSSSFIEDRVLFHASLHLSRSL